MKTIEIYCNYGVLAAEKRTVYTLRENSRSQEQGTIDFTLHGESEKKIKQYFNYKYGKKYNVEFVDDILATTGYYI